MRFLTAWLENDYYSITVANHILITIIRFISKSYTHMWKDFANKFCLVLHTCICFFWKKISFSQPNTAITATRTTKKIKKSSSRCRRQQQAGVEEGGGSRAAVPATPRSHRPNFSPPRQGAAGSERESFVCSPQLWLTGYSSWRQPQRRRTPQPSRCSGLWPRWQTPAAGDRDSGTQHTANKLPAILHFSVFSDEQIKHWTPHVTCSDQCVWTLDHRIHGTSSK